MKTFAISMIIFLILITIIVINFIYINNIAEKMLIAVEEIEKSQENRYEKINNFSNLWKKHKSAISLSVNYIYIGNISNRLAAVTSSEKQKDEKRFFHELTMLKEEIKELRRLEQFSCINLF